MTRRKTAEERRTQGLREMIETEETEMITKAVMIEKRPNVMIEIRETEAGTDTGIREKKVVIAERTEARGERTRRAEVTLDRRRIIKREIIREGTLAVRVTERASLLAMMTVTMGKERDNFLF